MNVRRVFSLDHKVIARQFLWSGFAFLAIGGLLAMLIRWQWAFPGRAVPLVGGVLFPRSGGAIGPAEYTTLFTMHGLIMIFFAITPILIGTFGNFCIPLLIGARDMAFPRLNMLSFWTFALSLVLVLASFCVRLGSAKAGWTGYPPLSTGIGTPGDGQTLVVLALFVSGLATLMGAINYVTTVIRMRAPGMGYFRMPLTIWGLWLTAILNVLFAPVLGSAALLLLLDRTLHTQFFIAGAAAVRGGGDPILYQHLFWIFGHPEVYILILPAWGIVGDLTAFFARKPAYWYRGSCYAMIAVTLLSGLVYGHHMYVSGLRPLLGAGFEALTLLISAPAMVLTLNWLNTLRRGAIRFTTPMLFTLGTIFVFGAGGLTGLYLGAIASDIYLHDTMFVVGHFHLTMAASSYLASLAGIYYWFPKMFGRALSERLGKIHFWCSFVLLPVVFGGQLWVGYAGQQRRLWDAGRGYAFLAHLAGANRHISYVAFLLGASQLLFVVNVVVSLLRGQRAERNPWQVGTLEWTTASPPPEQNFDREPVVQRGPHELGNPAVRAALGRDFVMQDEVLPEGVRA
jgi:cytochrome c oxidase subunit 1